MTTPSVSNSLYPEYPAFQPVPSSLLRKIRDVVTKIFHDWVVTLRHRWGTLNVLSKLEFELESCRALKRTRQLSPTAVIEYGRLLEKGTPLQWVDTGLPLGERGEVLESRKLPKRQPGVGYLAIPYVLKGLVENHIVAIGFDVTTNTLEYYDSKGLTIRDRNDSELNGFIREVLKEYGNESTNIVENTEKHQWDCHNCGIYVLDYFARRRSGNLPGYIFRNGREFNEVNCSIRKQMIEQLETDHIEQVNAARAKK